MITLYQTEWCPYCHRVRQVLTELGLTFTAVNVPAANEDRVELIAIAGQDGVPVLTDGDRIYTDSDEIIEYLRATYPEPEDAEENAALGAWRAAVMVSLAPRAALARLREVLEEKGFVVLAQVKGPKINERLPKEYTILQVTVPVAAVKIARRRPAGAGGDDVPHRRHPHRGRQERGGRGRPRRAGVALRRDRADPHAGRRQEAAARGVRGALTGAGRQPQR